MINKYDLVSIISNTANSKIPELIPVTYLATDGNLSSTIGLTSLTLGVTYLIGGSIEIDRNTESNEYLKKLRVEVDNINKKYKEIYKIK